MLCYVHYTSLQNRDQHLNGSLHKKRYEASIKYGDSVGLANYCKLCYTMTNDKSQLERHLNSDNHMRSVKQYKEMIENKIAPLETSIIPIQTIQPKSTKPTSNEVALIKYVSTNSTLVTATLDTNKLNEKWTQITNLFEKLKLKI